MNIAFLFADKLGEWNTSEWLMRIPADSISRLEGHKAALVHIDAVLRQEPQAVALTRWADVIIIERNLWNPTIGLVRALKNVGKLVIACFDDAYHLMRPSNPSATHWLQNLAQLPDGSQIAYKPGFLSEWKACLKEFHAYHTPSELLTQDWLHINPRGFTVRNYPDYNWPSWGVKRSRRKTPFTVAWGGGASHYDSFHDSNIIPALRQLCEKYPYIQIAIISGDKRIPELLKLPPNQLYYHPGVSLEVWPSLIPELDVGFVPLAGKYDDRRSWLKAIEFGAMGVPWVALNGPPYQGCSGGFLIEDTIEAWVQHLGMLITDKSLREHLGASGRQWARAQAIDNHVAKRLSLYTRLLEELRISQSSAVIPTLPTVENQVKRPSSQTGSIGRRRRRRNG